MVLIFKGDSKGTKCLSFQPDLKSKSSKISNSLAPAIERDKMLFEVAEASNGRLGKRPLSSKRFQTALKVTKPFGDPPKT